MKSKTDKSDYHGVLLEDIQRQVGRLTEAMADVPNRVNSIDERLAHVEEGVETIKVVVSEQSREIKSHQAEISKLKTAA